MRCPVIIAHRGASAKAPENTIASFRKAIELGAGGIELDVQLSSDGHLVIIHDEQIDRTGSGTGWVKDKTLAELKEQDFGGWFSPDFKGEKIPTLYEVMELLHGWDGLLNIEIKSGLVFYPGIEKKIIDMIIRFGMSDQTIISSFNHYALIEVKKIAPQLKTGALFKAGLYKPWEYAKLLGADAINPIFYNIVPEIMEGCRQNGILVNPFTVDRPEDILRMADAGVSGIITNVPDIALGIL